jgi:hypothetical protein
VQEPEKASEKQTAYIASLCREKGLQEPDGPLTKEQASQVISELQSGTYDPTAWAVPF